MTTIIVTIILNIFSSIALLVVPLFVCGGKKEAKPRESSKASRVSEGKRPLPEPPQNTTAGGAPEAKSKSQAPEEAKGEGSKKAAVAASEDKKEEKKEEEKGEEPKKEEEKKEEEKKEEGSAKKAALSVKNQPYPSIKGPSKSKKEKKLEELEKEKKKKIEDGFYQSKSDEDDTLEKVASLKEEQSGRSNKKSAKSKKK